MLETMKEEKFVDLFDFCRRLLLKWKQILLCTIVCAVAFAGWNYAKSYREIKAVSDMDDGGFTSISEQEGEALIKTVANYQQVSAETREYLDKSVLMQLPTGNATTYSMQYCLNSTTTEPISREAQEYLVWAYSRAMQTDDVYGVISEELAPEYDVPPLYVSELFSVGKQSYDGSVVVNAQGYDVAIAAETKETETENLPRVLVVSITGSDETFCKIIADILDQKIQDSTSEIAEIIPHSATFISGYYNSRNRNDLTEKRNDKLKVIKQCAADITTLTAKLTSAEKEYVNDRVNGIVRQKTERKPELSIKTAIAGAILGALAISAIYALCYFLSPKVHTEGEIEQILHQKSFGVIDDTKKKKSVLDKLLPRKDTSLNRQTAIELIKEQIQIKAKKEKIHTIGLTYTATSNVVKPLQDELIAELAKTELQPVAVGNILCEPEALIAATKVDALILIGAIDNTNTKELRKLMLRCQDQEMKILGNVILA